MMLNSSVTKILRRLAIATVTSAVVTFVALYPRAQAETDCSLRDVSRWQTELTDAETELTPAHILSVTEAFISACPTRPEIPQARQVAAMAAVDLGEVAVALGHFQQAGRLYDARTKYYYAATLLASGQDRQAWDVRDDLVNQWLDRVSYDPQVMLDETAVRGGVIYTVTFMNPDPDSGIRSAWVGVPDGAGWPATLTLASGRQRAAFYKLGIGETDEPVRHIDIYRCRGRTLLGRAASDLSADGLDEAARTTLLSYFADPDRTSVTAIGARPEVCIWPDRLLPAPAR